LPIVSSGRASRGVTQFHPRPRRHIGRIGELGVGFGVRIGLRRHGLIGRCPRIGAVVEQFAKTERPSTGQLRQRYNHGRRGLLNRYRLGVETGRSGHSKMRFLGAAVAGVLALVAPIAADAGTATLGSSARPVNTGLAPAMVQVWNGNGPGWHHTVPDSWGGGWHPGAGRVSKWKGGWCPPHWGPSGSYGGWGPFGGPGVPTYWVWGPSGGAFDYPFSDWRGPDGGWGNP
jgi:hypothetical protein